MKVIGQKTLLAELAILTIIILIILFKTGLSIIMIILLVIFITRLVHAPVIRIDNSILSISTLFPPRITVARADVQKVSISTGFTVRFVVYLKNGGMLTKTAAHYSSNLAPLIEALQVAGIPVERTEKGK